MDKQYPPGEGIEQDEETVSWVRLMEVSNQARNQVDKDINGAAMAEMLNLRDVIN